MVPVIRTFVAMLFVLRPLVIADKFTTLADMENLLQTQVKVIRSLQNFVSKEKKRINFLETHLQRCRTEYTKAVEDVPNYLENPINAFSIIKRLSTDLDFVENVIKDKTGYKRNNTVTYPTDEDLKAAVTGFVRLQQTYKLNITELANGVVAGAYSQSKNIFKEVVTPMSASDCYYIGNISFAKKIYPEAIAWFTEAWDKFERVGCDLCPFTEDEVIDQISQAYYFLDDLNNTIKWVNKKIALKPDAPETIREIQFVNFLKHRLENEAKKSLKQVASETNEYLGTTAKEPDMTYFEALCQGKVSAAEHIRPGLKCFYPISSPPLLSLMRVKFELLHREPDITLIHDIVSDHEIGTLLALSKPMIWKNGTLSNVTKNSESNYRNAKSVSLENITSDVADEISQRISLFTGLRMENSEPLRIIHYGIGGIYENHFDCNTVGKAPIPFFEKYGDRIATVMIYLSDVAQGGATVFPELQLNVFPKKGSALFWMNLLPSGDRDDAVIHAACPVLRGSKWIAIKWPHEVPQMYCPAWRTKRGLMDNELYSKFTREVHSIREEHERRKRERDEL